MSYISVPESLFKSKQVSHQLISACKLPKDVVFIENGVLDIWTRLKRDKLIDDVVSGQEVLFGQRVDLEKANILGVLAELSFRGIEYVFIVVQSG